MEKFCVNFLLCASCWYVHKPDVQNKWEDNTHIERDWAEGRLKAFYFNLFIFILFCTSCISDSVANIRWCIISTLNVFKICSR